MLLPHALAKFLQDRDTALRQHPGRHPRCHFFSTFFLNKLYRDEKRYNYKNVSTAAVYNTARSP
jgi:hypothetical protein